MEKHLNHDLCCVINYAVELTPKHPNSEDDDPDQEVNTPVGDNHKVFKPEEPLIEESKPSRAATEYHPARRTKYSITDKRYQLALNNNDCQKRPSMASKSPVGDRTGHSFVPVQQIRSSYRDRRKVYDFSSSEEDEPE
jgi:hypothetical protein